MKYPTYYRKAGTAIFRRNDTIGTQVITPDDPSKILPLSMSTVTYPSKERFDEAVASWEEVDKACYENYVMDLCGRVQRDIDRPLTEARIKVEVAKNEKMKQQWSV